MAKAKIKTDSKGQKSLWFVCPACRDVHSIHVAPDKSHNGSSWEWNGDTEAPTVSPSIKMTVGEPGKRLGDGLEWCCHSFLRNGVMEYCGDCTHEHAGQSLPLPEYEFPLKSNPAWWDFLGFDKA